MTEENMTPSVIPGLLGLGIGVVVESYLLWRSGQRPKRTEPGAHTTDEGR